MHGLILRERETNKLIETWSHTLTRKQASLKATQRENMDVNNLKNITFFIKVTNFKTDAKTQYFFDIPVAISRLAAGGKAS